MMKIITMKKFYGLHLAKIPHKVDFRAEAETDELNHLIFNGIYTNAYLLLFFTLCSTYEMLEATWRPLKKNKYE